MKCEICGKETRWSLSDSDSIFEKFEYGLHLIRYHGDIFGHELPITALMSKVICPCGEDLGHSFVSLAEHVASCETFRTRALLAALAESL